MVGLCIGMSNVYEAARIKPKTEDGKIDFWAYARKLQISLLQGFEDNHHFGFIKARIILEFGYQTEIWILDISRLNMLFKPKLKEYTT